MSCNSAETDTILTQLSCISHAEKKVIVIVIKQTI